MRSRVVGAIALWLAVAGALSCGDLFHDTAWTPSCEADPSRTGCPAPATSAGPSAGSGGASSSSEGSGADGPTSAGGSAGDGGSGGEAPATCGDGSRNGDESDVDCGGDCFPCRDGKDCVVGADCAVGVCSAGVCGCGGPGQACCADGCAAPLACDQASQCRILDLPNAVGCAACKSLSQLCVEHGFTAADAGYAYWLGQCGGPGTCPVGWTGLTCANWCGASNCVGHDYCGPEYILVTTMPPPDAPLCATDHGGNCVSDAPGYYVRAHCL